MAMDNLSIPLFLFFVLIGCSEVTCNSHQKSLHMQGLEFRVIPKELIGQTLDAHPDIRELYMADNGIDLISKSDFPAKASQLTYLSLQGNRISHIAEGSFEHMVNLVEVDLGQNNLVEVPDLKAPNLKIMNLSYNRIPKIESKALQNFKNLEKLVLTGNPLINIAEHGLLGPKQLTFLYLDGTQLRSLPPQGISSLTVLNIKDTPLLLTLPSADKFTRLAEANLTYGMHCCAFRAFDKKRAKKNKEKGNLSESETHNFNDTSTTSLVISKDKDTPEHINCLPQPTVFTPCDSILISDVLRGFAWLIAVFALVGNLLQLIVLSHSSHHLSASKLLIYNLAFSNLLMGVYLFGLCCTDADTYGIYYSHVPRWQFDGGCQAFGFLAVFSINLTMCCLVLLAIERFLLLNYTSEVGEEVKMSHVVYCLIASWVYSFTIALLPATNAVSSYIDNAICLPLDTHTGTAKGYVTWLLLSFIIAFIVIIYCYMEVLRKSGDHVINIRIAKRLLMVTCGSFLCWLPISIIGLSVLYSRFDFLNQSILKYLLVLFFPLHSIVTPALYGIVNKTFRKEALGCLCSCGCKQMSDTHSTHSSHSNHKPVEVEKAEKGSGNNKHDVFHMDVPGDLNNMVRKHPVSIIEEHPECDDPHTPLTIKITDSLSKENIPKENSYSYSPRYIEENDLKRFRSASSNVIDNKRYSDARYRSDTTATCSTGVSATSDVELREM